MCGIVGYIGEKFVDPVLVVDLERLEYRGYDSAGIATLNEGELCVRKRVGRLRVLDDAVKQSPLGGTIAVVTEGDAGLSDIADHTFTIPECSDHVEPILSVVPLQLLAYHIATLRGCDVDKPRNLAKSVTVE